MRRFWMLLPILAALLAAPTMRAADLAPHLKALQAVGPQAAGNRQAQAAWQELAKADVKELPTILAGIDEAGPLGANWIRAVVDSIAERQLQRGGALPRADLEKFVLETQHSPLARRLAFEWLTRVDAAAPDRLIPGMLHDPSVEFRRDAVERLLAEAKPLYDAKQTEQVAPIYQKALAGARDLDQIELLTKRLREFEQPVDLPRHFGFLMEWKLIGPFDNTDKKGFDVAYPPEKSLDFDASYEGKTGTVRWVDFVSSDDYGMIDFNKGLGKNMGAVGYAVAHYDSPREQKVDLRLGCINGNKLWLNGKLLDQHNVYHSGTKVDQYLMRASLKAGRNVLLVKCCQNEQTDSWAQNWQFQLRICDATGTALLAENRLPTARPAKENKSSTN